MTTEIEKQFLDTFNIEKTQVDCEQLLRLDCEDCKTCKYSVYEYPEITDRILLELICIVNSRRILPNLDVNGLKEYVLKELCTMVVTEQFKTEVQSLFKEG